MISFVYLLCDPIVVFGSLLLISAILKYVRKDKKSFVVLIVAIFWMFLVSTSPFSQWMVWKLESRHDVFQLQEVQHDTAVHVLVLGGGHTNSPELPAGSQLSSTAMLRLAEGIRIHRQIPRSTLVCSGYSASNRTTQAEMLARTAVDLGVDPRDTLQNRSPRNTSEEIQAYKDRFGNSATLIVVTSAHHMPRAMMLCTKNGMRAIAAPADYYIKSDSRHSNFDFYPYTLKILMLENALHEYAGILKVKWIE